MATDQPAAESERFRRGKAKIEQLGGSTEEIFAPVADIAPDLARYVTEFAFGDLYSRPGLEPAQRRLLTVAALMALGDCAPQLRFPRAVNAMAEARAVFTARGLNGNPM